MNIEKLFGSKAKADILKYLIFRRQGVSMRALEAELGWTFPAIKKQVDTLQDAGVVTIDKDAMKRAIRIHDDVYQILKDVFLFALKKDLLLVLDQHSFIIQQYFLGKIFGSGIETDLVIVYHHCEKESLDMFKNILNELFRKYGIEVVYLTFFSASEWQTRYQLADKFVLSVMRG